MLFTDLFEGRDMCNVCGQTPCNCTHLAEGVGNVGSAIKALYQKIYNAGDDEFEYFYNDSPIFAQYWDEYEGDLDSIIAEVDPAELQVMRDELESYVDQAGLMEMDSQGYTGSRDRKSMSKYGSRDDYELGGPETTLGPDSIAKPKDVAKKGADTLNRAMRGAHPDYSKHEKKLIGKMSNAEKVNKGWRNPNIDEGSLEEIDRRGFLKGMGAAAVAISPAFKAMAQDYSMSDKEITILSMLFNAYWVCLHYPKTTDPQKCNRIQQGISEYSKRRGWTSQELNGFYTSANSQNDEKLKDPRWVEIINQSYARSDNLLKMLNQERPFESINQGVAEVSDATLTSYLTKVDADSQKHEKDPTKRSADKRNKSVTGFSRAFNKLDARKEKSVSESLADEFMKLAREKGMNPRLRGTPEQERERTNQMLAQRAADREQQAQQAAQSDAANLPDLEQKYQELTDKYQSLGGSNWQYADREQNLSDREREARAMEPELRRLGAQIAAAKKASISESNDIVKSLQRLREADPAYTGIDPVVRSRMGMPPAGQDEIRKFLDKNPPVVTSGSGAPVTTGTGATVQSGGAVDVAKAADAASPDRAMAVAKPAGTIDTMRQDNLKRMTAGANASAVTKPVTTPTVTPAPIPQASAATVPPKPTFSKGVTDIAAANKIADPNKISVGQSIKLPSGQSYTVAKGDTLSGISSGQYKGNAPTAATTTPPPSVVRTNPAPSTAPTTTTPAATATPVKPTTPPSSVAAPSTIRVPNMSGAGQKGPTVAAATGSDSTNPINKVPYGTGNSVPPTTMFNKMPPGSTGAVTKEGEGERKAERPEADYGADYQAMVARVKKLAGLGPLKTVWDPAKRVYKNVPTAVQPGNKK